MLEAPRVEPERVQRMRAAGYDVRVGTGQGSLPEIPDAFFHPPASLRSRMQRRIMRVYEKLVGAPASARRTPHAPFP